MCADDELHPYLFLFLHLTGKLFHLALSPLMLELICQVASTLGVSWDWAEVQLLAKLGGWEPLKDRHPGKITLQRGLSHLLDMLVTQAKLSQYEITHHALPPQIAAFLHHWGPPHQL
jgi:hypothetical protein